MTRQSVLILGGTSEAVALAHAAIKRFGPQLRVISSLAGVTAVPAAVPGEVRRGGFGGVDGLAAYLKDQSIDLVVDATHPYAATISRNALEACNRTGVPRLTVLRPTWPEIAGERRIVAPDMATAARKLVDLGARRVFVTTGAKDLDALAAAPDTWFLIRLIEPLSEPLPLRSHALIYGRGPFTESGERKLMIDNQIDGLLTKHSGGHVTYSKIVAARDLGLPVVMIARPTPPSGAAVESIQAALDWIDARLSIAT
jgi:precorrin-6A/cobalt-precorrin-6A reductase